MNDLNILKDVGLKEVSRKTYIGREFLEHIVNKDYEKLTHVNVNGYIKILQREYGIDLSEWIQEYEQYCKDNKINEALRTKVDPKLKSYTGSGVGTNNVSGSSLGWLLWLLIFIVFIVASYFLDAYKYIESLPDIFEDKNRSVVYSDSSVVQEVSKNISVTQENVNIPATNKSKEQNISVEISFEQQNTKALNDISSNSTDNNLSKEEPADNLNPEEVLSKTDMATEEIKNESDLNATLVSETNEDGLKKEYEMGISVAKGKNGYIVPKSKVWIGVIDLKNKTKKSSTVSERYDLDLTGEKLIVCGNGNIVIHIDDEQKTFDPGRAARFLIKDGDIRFLTYDEFLSLNGGKSW
ncbi:hypothetical protein CPIN17260_0170 [Campylobacter pinnipediorum subsp. pinnipediorum]|uniref:hypothetical protein n=1 Tax=Campylobacter pinnipediorum TaxID=1965231 RepID=UPI0009959A4C|nr:hypothetical protein [Campylobacter pinnipediorum]AQW80525.1 hypothetical protein CPIN17260_0170 [Campylobacter pinnipediorum subsp. pinnipediorum]